MIEDIYKLLESFKKHQISQVIEKINAKAFEIIHSQHASEKIKEYFENISTEGAPFSDFEREPDNISQIKKLINALYYARLTFIDLENADFRNLGAKKKWMFYQEITKTAYEASYLLTHLDVDLREMFKEELDFLLPKFGLIEQFARDQKSTLEKKFADGDDVAKKIDQPEKTALFQAGNITGIAADQMRPLSGTTDYNFLTKFSAVLPGYINDFSKKIEEYSTEIKKNEPTLNPTQLAEIEKAALNLLNDIEKLKGNSLFLSLKFLNYIHIIRNIITLSMSTLEQIGNLSESSQNLVRDNLAQLKYVLLPTLFGLVDKIEVNCMLQPGTLSLPLMDKVQGLYGTLIQFTSKAVDLKTEGEELRSIEDSRFIELRLDLAYKRIDNANKAIYKNRKAKTAFEEFYNELKKPEYQNLNLHQLPDGIQKNIIEHYKIFKPFMLQLDIEFNDRIINGFTKPESLSSYLYKHSHIDSLKSNFSMPSLPSRPTFSMQPFKTAVTSVKGLYSYVSPPWKWNSNTIRSKLPSLPALPKLPALPVISTEDIAQTVMNRVEGVSSYTPKPPNKLSVKAVLEKQKALEDLIIKNENSQIFHIDLNKAVIDSVHKQANLALFPYKAKKSIYTIDETIPLNFKIDKLKLKLSADDFVILSKRFERLKKKLETSPMSASKIVEIKRLYKILRPYFIYIFPTESTEKKDDRERPYTAVEFDKDLADLITNKSLNSPVERIQQITEQGLQNLTLIKNNWPINCAHYCLETQSYLDHEQSQALVVAEENELLFKKLKNNVLLQNPQLLNADQARDLSEWYRNKESKCTIAQKAYKEFIDILTQENFYENIHNLPDLSTDLKNQCRNLYNIFQPYYVGSASTQNKDQIIFLDKFLVSIFANKPAIELADFSPRPQSFAEQSAVFEKHLHSMKMEWHKNSLTYNELSEEKFVSEHKAANLIVQIDKNKRAHYLLKDTDISEGISKFRTALFEMVNRFNKPMQAELVPQKLGTPYPEMEDSDKQLQQSTQVRAIKDVYNCLYYLEKIALELEQLTHKQLHGKLEKGLYVNHLIKAYGHINQITILSQRIASDPHSKLIVSELITKAQNLYATFQQHSNAYQVAPEEISVKGTVKYTPLWYALNAFYISPSHIRTLKNTNYLTPEELNKLHENAKFATLTIEKLINNSNSYFKLFLQTPNMLILYKQLTQKLNEFTTTAHDAVLNNLDKIRPNILTPMLHEADRWEDKLGLAPGSFSKPLREITDEFFKGFLNPLNLHSQKHIELLCTAEPLEQRTELIKSKITSLENKINAIDEQYKNISNLYAQMKHLKNLLPGWELREPYKTNLRQTYKKILPQIAQLDLDKKINPHVGNKESDYKFDEVCNQGLDEWDRKYTEIDAWASASYHYGLGLKASYQMKLGTAKEKLGHLTQLQTAQTQEKTDFVEAYTEKAFAKHLKALCGRYIGLQSTKDEYEKELREELLNFKEEIINKSQNTNDINTNIINLLQEKISLFEKRRFEPYYKLDLVKIALAGYRAYFKYQLEEKNHTFHPDDPLPKKIASIEKTANNLTLTIPERLAKIKQKINNPLFKTIMLTPKHTDTFSVAYLKMCFLWLLEAVGLYKSTRSILFKTLTHAAKQIDQPTRFNELSQKFGLFASRPAPVPLPPAAPAPALPTPSP